MVRVNYKDILDKLTAIWTVCYGVLTVQTVSGYFINHVWLPYIGFLLMVMVIWFGNRNISRSSVNCSLMTHYTVYILGVTGLIMLVINLLNTNLITNNYSEFSHKNYPFHVSFIIYPVATLYYGIAIYRQSKPEYCRACKAIAAFSIKEALRRNVLHNEAKFQIKMAFWISAMLTVVTYAYYIFFYRSNNMWRMHTPDVFFMYVFPGVTFLVSGLYVITKYSGQEFEISFHDAFDDEKRSTRLRFMVICNDKVMLSEKTYEELGGASIWDTAAERQMDFYEGIPLDKVKDIFSTMSGIDDFEIRKLFSSNSKLQNINHYAVFLPDKEADETKLNGHWFSLGELDVMLSVGAVSRAFATEMQRVHTITMAWKTYDRNGKRLYPVKNYRPSFRLRDFKKWTVDYEDLHWINVSKNNQDKPFYKLRRIWRKYVTGVEGRWNGRQS